MTDKLWYYFATKDAENIFNNEIIQPRDFGNDTESIIPLIKEKPNESNKDKDFKYPFEGVGQLRIRVDKTDNLIPWDIYKQKIGSDNALYTKLEKWMSDNDNIEVYIALESIPKDLWLIVEEYISNEWFEIFKNKKRLESESR